MHKPKRPERPNESRRHRAVLNSSGETAIDPGVLTRCRNEVERSLSDSAAGDAELPGALRAMAHLSQPLRDVMLDALASLVRQKLGAHPLYIASIRALIELGDKRAIAQLKTALAGDDGGGAAALGAACFSSDGVLADPLRRLATSRQSNLAFRAEVARIARGESNGAHLVEIAPKIKEVYRIALCTETLYPLMRASPLPRAIGAGLAVLRSAERHLGRWLVMAEVATRAGDPRPLEEATENSQQGPASARSAWALVAWALAGASSGRSGETNPPPTKPTVDIIARLSDRPSADRDTTFLFRMAQVGAPSARGMLEALTTGLTLEDSVAVRAAYSLYRYYGRADMQAALLRVTESTTQENLRGLAMAALWDSGVPEMRTHAVALSQQLVGSPSLKSVAWSILVQSAANHASTRSVPAVLTETQFRWIQCGWLE